MKDVDFFLYILIFGILAIISILIGRVIDKNRKKREIPLSTVKMLTLILLLLIVALTFVTYLIYERV